MPMTEAQKRYAQSDKGKAARKKYQDKKKTEKEAKAAPSSETPAPTA